MQGIHAYTDALPSLLVRIYASLLSPAEMEAGREIGMIADDPGSDTLTADPSSVGIDTPCAYAPRCLSLFDRIAFRHFNDRQATIVCQMYRRAVTDPSLTLRVVHLSNASTSWSSAGMAW